MPGAPGPWDLLKWGGPVPNDAISDKRVFLAGEQYVSDLNELGIPVPEATDNIFLPNETKLVDRTCLSYRGQIDLIVGKPQPPNHPSDSYSMAKRL